MQPGLELVAIDEKSSEQCRTTSPLGATGLRCPPSLPENSLADEKAADVICRPSSTISYLLSSDYGTTSSDSDTEDDLDEGDLPCIQRPLLRPEFRMKSQKLRREDAVSLPTPSGNSQGIELLSKAASEIEAEPHRHQRQPPTNMTDGRSEEGVRKARGRAVASADSRRFRRGLHQVDLGESETRREVCWKKIRRIYCKVSRPAAQHLYYFV